MPNSAHHRRLAVWNILCGAKYYATSPPRPLLRRPVPGRFSPRAAADDPRRHRRARHPPRGRHRRGCLDLGRRPDARRTRRRRAVPGGAEGILGRSGGIARSAQERRRSRAHPRGRRAGDVSSRHAEDRRPARAGAPLARHLRGRRVSHRARRQRDDTGPRPRSARDPGRGRSLEGRLSVRGPLGHARNPRRSAPPLGRGAREFSARAWRNVLCAVRHPRASSHPRGFWRPVPQICFHREPPGHGSVRRDTARSLDGGRPQVTVAFTELLRRVSSRSADGDPGGLRRRMESVLLRTQLPAALARRPRRPRRRRGEVRVRRAALPPRRRVPAGDAGPEVRDPFRRAHVSRLRPLRDLRRPAHPPSSVSLRRLRARAFLSAPRLSLRARRVRRGIPRRGLGDDESRERLLRVGARREGAGARHGGSACGALWLPLRPPPPRGLRPPPRLRRALRPSRRPHARDAPRGLVVRGRPGASAPRPSSLPRSRTSP